jgi:hypothetical protein
MPVKNGNDNMVWVSAVGGTPALLGGQQDHSIEGSQQTIDATHKTSGTVNLTLPANRSISIPVNFVSDLPDAAYTAVETAHKNRTRVLVQIRKDGALGTAPDDVLFAAEMWAVNLQVNSPLNGAVAGSVTFELAAVPTTDLTLA